MQFATSRPVSAVLLVARGVSLLASLSYTAAVWFLSTQKLLLRTQQAALVLNRSPFTRNMDIVSCFYSILGVFWWIVSFISDLPCLTIGLFCPNDGDDEIITQAPSDNITQVPFDNATQAPFDKTTQAPFDTTTQAPYDNTTQAPYNNITQAPFDNATQAPYDWNCSKPANVNSFYEASVKAMTELLVDHQEPPPHLIDYENMNPIVQDGDFDVSSYFYVLEYLSLPENMVLDYVYVFDGMGGFPLLYVRNQADEPFATAADVGRTNYLNEIIIHSSPHGLLQFVILDVKGDQFYLYWHAAYNDYKIITSSANVEVILQQYPICEAGDEFEGLGCFGIEGVEMARGLDVSPTIQCDEDMVQVVIILFTAWGGFVQRTYSISRRANVGDRIVGIEEEVLVPFDIGIFF